MTDTETRWALPNGRVAHLMHDQGSFCGYVKQDDPVVPSNKRQCKLCDFGEPVAETFKRLAHLKPYRKDTP